MTPNIDVLSRNSNELESKEGSYLRAYKLDSIAICPHFFDLNTEKGHFGLLLSRHSYEQQYLKPKPFLNRKKMYLWISVLCLFLAQLELD